MNYFERLELLYLIPFVLVYREKAFSFLTVHHRYPDDTFSRRTWNTV